MTIYHKNLDVYKLALQFVSLAAEIAKRIPRGQRETADQLKRASTSVAYNIGEGAGEFASREKARFYRMALRSATESATIIDVVFHLEYIDAALHEQATNMIERIIAMLTKLVIRHSDAGNGKGRRDQERDRDPFHWDRVIPKTFS